MKLNRKVFYNKRNGQATVIIPSKTIKKLHKKFKVVSLNNISAQMLTYFVLLFLIALKL